MYKYTLETGSKKHLCPRCGRKTFVRVIDSTTGAYLPGAVGRCDRESRCRYQYTWKEYLRDSSDIRSDAGLQKSTRATRPLSAPELPDVKTAKVLARQKIAFRTADYLDLTHLSETIDSYECNSFVQFLMTLFPDGREAVAEAVKEYKIGTFDGWTSFPVIDRYGRFCKAKLMKFDSANGKRLKDGDGRGLIHSLQAKLKAAGRLKRDFETDKNVFFGEHLLMKYPRWPIAVVESKKTAVIASIYKGVFPDIIWLATGSKQWLKTERIARLGSDRTIILYPDADGYGRWQKVASGASRLGCGVKVSQLINHRGTEAEKLKQSDLADYLIREQQKRNDTIRQAAYEESVEERLSIMIHDGGLSLAEAEDRLENSGYLDEIEKMVLAM